MENTNKMTENEKNYLLKQEELLSKYEVMEMEREKLKITKERLINEEFKEIYSLLLESDSILVDKDEFMLNEKELKALGKFISNAMNLKKSDLFEVNYHGMEFSDIEKIAIMKGNVYYKYKWATNRRSLDNYRFIALFSNRDFIEKVINSINDKEEKEKVDNLFKFVRLLKNMSNYIDKSIDKKIISIEHSNYDGSFEKKEIVYSSLSLRKGKIGFEYGDSYKYFDWINIRELDRKDLTDKKMYLLINLKNEVLSFLKESLDKFRTEHKEFVELYSKFKEYLSLYVIAGEI